MEKTVITTEQKTGAETYSSAIEFATNYQNWILDEFRPFVGSKVLEVGLGHGNYRTCLPPQCEYIGIDIDEESIEQAKHKFPNDRLVCADIAADNFVNVIGTKVDSVICINVLEHVEDHDKGLSNLISVLKPGGFLFLFVPAFQSLYTDLDRLAGHHRRYRREDVAKLVDAKTADIVVNKYFNPIGGLAWWVNGFKKYDSLNDNAVNTQIVIFDRYILPLSRLMNTFTGGIFGQSLITIVRKKS